MRPSKRRDVQTKQSAIPATWGETLAWCPFRSLLGISKPPGDSAEMLTRLDHVFAALGGEPSPIDAALLEELVSSIRSGRCVLVVSDQPSLRDAAKREILARAHGVTATA